MRSFLFSVLLLSAAHSQAQTTKETEAIKSLCGCYNVDFKYTETFAPETNYSFSKPYHVVGLEYVVPIEVSPKKIVLQHLLVVDDSMIIKHWREDWEYEAKSLWQFDHDATWKRVAAKNNNGEWTQTVWEVDDAPRYQGGSKWISNNNKYYWENTTDAPLPRREYTKRKDYNVLNRTNRIILTDSGWLHEQDNIKIIRTTGAKDVNLAEEKGYNNYIRTSETKCASAAAWWTKYKEFWTVIRESWGEVMNTKTEIHLVNEVNGEKLYEVLDSLQQQDLTKEQLKPKAKEALAKFITNASGAATAIAK